MLKKVSYSRHIVRAGMTIISELERRILCCWLVVVCPLSRNKYGD